MTRLYYDTDLTDIQWSLLEKLLPPPAKTERKPIDKRWIIDAIQYVLRRGYDAGKKVSGRNDTSLLILLA